ncbi:DNA polymerase III subunit beta [Blattabacterium cuenoti]|uniref:DNA polymerase III subunit beta n=1 Tax=Blattabacterium cuenoti TaxID=1653831 RepID=UPI00163BFF3B|nr:DNA polymerase III subunit beta [Blattabacterium cuenoti]
MHFSVSRFSFLQKLYALHKIITPPRNSEYFLLEIFGEKLMIMLSDSENLITTEIQVYVKKYSKEKVAVHPQLIIDILRTFSDETLLIKFKKEKKILNIGSKQGDYNIPIIFKSHLTYFNKKKLSHILHPKKKITLFSNMLLNILNKTLFVIENNKEELRPIMNGVFFQFSSYGSTFVATDTYKLVKYTIDHIKLDQFIEFTIPKKSLNILKKILINETNEKSKVTIEYHNKMDLKFYLENETFSCLLINEKYPNYNSFIPNKYDVSFIINRISFLNSIKRISILNKKKTSFIRFYFLNDNRLKIYEENARISSFLTIIQYESESIDNSFQKKEIKIGFNSQFLIEILSSFNEDFVRFELYSTFNKVGILRPINNKKEESILILIMSVIIL